MTMVDLYSDSGTNVLATELNQWGLGSLADEAAGIWARDPDPGRFMQWVRGTQQYKNRFPYMDQLAKEGRAISENEALSYERATRQLFRNAGLPAGTFDNPAYINKLILADVSYAELEQRVQSGLVKSLQAPTEVRQFFASRLGDAGDAALAAFYLDPDHTMTDIHRIETQAQVVGRGQRLGLQIDPNRAVDFALGYSPEEVQQRLAQAAEFSPLGRGVVGGTGIDDTTLAASSFTGDTRKVNRELEQRTAAFAGGGGAAVGENSTGFGSAQGA